MTVERCEEVLKQQLLKYDLQVENICTLDRYDDSVSEKVLALLLEWACYGQHMLSAPSAASIEASAFVRFHFEKRRTASIPLMCAGNAADCS